jgi:pyruvate,water dikinase
MDITKSMILTPTDTPDIAAMGGKAFSLARLNNAFPGGAAVIPPWFVVTPSAFDDLGLTQSAKALITDQLLPLGAGPFAVRSSAVDEDGLDSSFAGQLESYLNIEPARVIDAVGDVYRSAFADQVVAYRKQRGLTTTPTTPAVLVQEMVNAATAGVVFSVDPVEGRRDRMVIIATVGLADKLVTGQINGNTYHVSRSGQLLTSDLVGETPLLDENALTQIVQSALVSEKHFGAPQDMEWVFDTSGHLYIVQSRPITTLSDPTTSPVDPHGRVIWDNSNIVESYSGIVSPLTFSFASYVYSEVYRAFSRMMGVSRPLIEEKRSVFDNMLGYIHGRVYYNLLNWYRVLRLFPGYGLNRSFMEQMMGVKEPLPDDIAHTLDRTNGGGRFGKGGEAVRLFRTLFQLIGSGIILPRTVSRFENTLNRALSQPNEVIATLCLSQLADAYRTLEKKLLARWDAPLINDFLCMIAFGVSRKALLKWLGDEGGASLHNDLMIGQGQIISAEPAKRIRLMAALVKDDQPIIQRLIQGDLTVLDDHPPLADRIQSYLHIFGDRCAEELKLESIPLSDDPVSLLNAIGSMATRATNSDAPADDPTDTSHPIDADDRLDAALAQWPVRRFLGRWLIDWTKKRIRDRENLRFERTRVFGRVRRIVLAMGDRLTEAGALTDRRDVFYLRIEELLGLIEGTATTANTAALVALRKKDADRYHTLADPPNRFETNGAVGIDMAQRKFHTSTPHTGGDERKGLGCCRGIVTAPIRTITDPRTESLLPGEIMVARHTDPGWIAVFANAAAIAVERGSLLSHSAIVAREMGIPAVVAVPDLLSWLTTGDVVELDGTTGRIIRVVPHEK